MISCSGGVKGLTPESVTLTPIAVLFGCIADMIINKNGDKNTIF